MVHRLPVVGSTAASTAFVSAKIDGPHGTFLFIDGNGKITAGNGTLEDPSPNAFSLVQIKDCPQSTATCRASCYVHSLEEHQSGTHALYKHNSSEIRKILTDQETSMEWAVIMGTWIRENASQGFRWHVSGDVFSLEYARWIATVCAEAPNVRFWIYTRSFEYLEPLHGASTLRGGNLSINLSCDVDNWGAAVQAAHDYGVRWPDTIEPLRLAYLTVDGKVPDDLEAGDVIFPDYNLRPRQYATLAESPWWETLTPAQKKMVCPVDAHGKSDRNRCGSCVRCMK